MSEFTDYLQEVFSTFGPVHIKRMFGGHGMYYQQLMIGLVADDVLYLKADEKSRAYFEALNLEQFEYLKKDKIVKMSYYQAPEIIYDDPDEACQWADRAFEAALRSDKRRA